MLFKHLLRMNHLRSCIFIFTLAVLSVSFLICAQVSFSEDIPREELNKFLSNANGAKSALEQSIGVKSSAEQAIGIKSPVNQPNGFKSPAELSIFETYVSETLNKRLNQYGYGLFGGPPSTFAPVEILPVGPGYLLGPGDELRISLWGKISADYMSVIDREGRLSIPEIGVIHIAGLTFSEAKDFLQKELNRYYKPSEVKLNVSMGRLRTMRVFVVGNVDSPGSYTISSLSTLINALFAAGGPSKTGSMRDVQVKRKGETVARFDLYDFLLKGDKGNDIRLMPEDVVFVPPVGPLVAVEGAVKSPAIYELKGETTVGELLELSGGLTDIAYRSRLQVIRVQDSARQVVFESAFEETDVDNLKVRPGDILRVFQVVRDTRVVRLSGSVFKPGEYGISDGLTVKKLIEMAGGLKPFAYREDAELTRVKPTPAGPKTEKLIINLSKALEGDPAHNIPLIEDDYLFVRNVPEWKLYRTVNISGEVRFPGTYTIKDGETLSSLIERAGGYTDKAYFSGAVFTRESVRELQQRHLDEAINRLELQLLSESTEALKTSLSIEETREKQLTADFQRRALIAKMKSARAKGRIAIRLAEVEELKGGTSDLVLEEGDHLHIPQQPSQVQVIGAVYNQTAFVYNPDAPLSTYIDMAGGLTEDADSSEMYVLKIDGTAISKKDARGWGLAWDKEGSRWVSGRFMSRRLDPGDTIVVPQETEKIAWLREVKDITQILYQIAVTAGVLIVAF